MPKTESKENHVLTGTPTNPPCQPHLISVDPPNRKLLRNKSVSLLCLHISIYCIRLFSGNKSIEDILARYINLPEHERGRHHNQEFLQRALGNLSIEAYQTYQATSSTTADFHLEEIQQEIFNCKSQLQNIETRLRIYEGDPFEITTLYEIQYREQILEETLKQVRLRRKRLEGEYNYSPSTPPTSQAHLPQEMADMNDTSVTESSNNTMDELLSQRDPQVQIPNFVDSNGLLPLRDEPGQCVVEILPPPLNVFQGQNMIMDDQIIPRAAALEEDTIDVNLSPWTEFYPTVLRDLEKLSYIHGAYPHSIQYIRRL
ncbi:hypothetical protein ACOSQ4_010718 [Xanthoceras sorbifolium]